MYTTAAGWTGFITTAKCTQAPFGTETSVKAQLLEKKRQTKSFGYLKDVNIKRKYKMTNIFTLHSPYQ